MKLVSMTYPFCEIPAPPDSSKLVPLRVGPDFLLCVPRSAGVAVRGPRSFSPPAVPAARVLHAQLCNTPGRPPKQASSQLLGQMWALGLPAQASVLQRRSEGDG